MTFTVYKQAVHKIDSDYFHYDYGYILTEEIIEVPSVKKFANFTKSNIPIRVGANKSTRKRLDLKPNQIIPVRGVLRSGWVVVIPGPNSDAYIYAPKFVKLSLMKFEVTPHSGKFIARNKDIPIYSHPSLEADVVSTLGKGYQLNILGKVKGAGWYQLRPFTDDTKAYVQIPGENPELPSQTNAKPMVNHIQYSAPENLNILDIKIGGNRDDAIKIVDENYGNAQLYEYKEALTRNRYTTPEFFLGIKKVINTREAYQPDGGYIQLLFDQRNTERVLGVDRRIVFPRDQRPTRETVLENLKSKFGAPKYSYDFCTKTASLHLWVADPNSSLPKDYQNYDGLKSLAGFGLPLSASNYPHLNLKAWTNSPLGHHYLCHISYERENRNLVTQIRFVLEDTREIGESIAYVNNMLIAGDKKQLEKAEKLGEKVKLTF